MVHEARRVEQDVDLADALGEGVNVGGAAHVELRSLGNTFLSQARDAALIDVGGDDGCAFTRECNGACAPDACRCSRDDGALSLEAVCHLYSPRFSQCRSPDERASAISGSGCPGCRSARPGYVFLTQ
ncbi:hypothetical protein ACVWZK_006277 [Bradyrhizobium sp. GM0.4]